MCLLFTPPSLPPSIYLTLFHALLHLCRSLSLSFVPFYLPLLPSLHFSLPASLLSTPHPSPPYLSAFSFSLLVNSVSPFTSLPLSLPFLPPSLRPSLLPNELVHLVMYNIVMYSDKCVLLLLAGQPHWPAASVPTRGHEYGGCRAAGDEHQFFTGNRGWGLKAAADLNAGDFMIEYVGTGICVVGDSRKRTRPTPIISMC